MARADLPTAGHARLNWHAKFCSHPCLLAQEACWGPGKEKTLQEQASRDHPKPRAGLKNAARRRFIAASLVGRSTSRVFYLQGSETARKVAASWWVWVHLDNNGTPRWAPRKCSAGPPFQGRHRSASSF